MRRPAVGFVFPERGLAAAVRTLLALVLLLPLVYGPGLVYPFVVGKALYARVLIALAFAAWAVLALARPAWRPPRSTLLVLVGVWAAVSVAAAVFGVSPQRSLWSHYGRMQGLFDLAHWLAFAVMAASVLRTWGDWRAMLLVNQLVGLATAVQAVAGHVWPEWFAPASSHGEVQASGLMGNPGYLAAYLQAVTLIGAGFLVRAATRPVAVAAPAGRAERRRRGREPPPGPARRPWAGIALHATIVALALWALALAGSRGAAVGLVAGAAAGALLVALSGTWRRGRLTVAAVVGSLVLSVASLGGMAAWRMASDTPPAWVSANPLLERLTGAGGIAVSAGARLDNWRAGARAFAERPLLGWGPDNYLAAAGKHLSADAGRYQASRGTVNEGRDHAHNVLVEEAATKGAVGLAAWLALMAWTAVVALRAVRAAEPGKRAVVAGAAAALAGWYVQSLTWFYFPVAWLVHLLPLAFLARCEAGEGTATAAGQLRLPGWACWIAGVAALALAVGSLAANRAMYAGAAALYRAETSGTERFMDELEASMRAFDPMATHPRILLFANIAPNWAVLRARATAEAFRLLEWADREAPKALAAEPHNWQVHHALAQLYREVAKTEPEYAELAARYHASARQVAPNLDPRLPMRRPPRKARSP